MSQYKLPTLGSFVDPNQVEILQSKLLGGRALGRVTDLVSSYLRQKGFTENQSLICANQLSVLCMSILTNTTLSSNVLTLEFTVVGNEFWFGVRGILSPIRNPIELKNQVNLIPTPTLSSKQEYVVHVRKLVCSWICSFVVDEKFGKPPEIIRPWNWNLTNQEYVEEDVDWKNLGDYNTEQWVKEQAKLKGNADFVKAVDGTEIKVAGDASEAAAVDSSVIRVKGDEAFSKAVDSTQTVLKGDATHAQALDTTQTYLIGDASHAQAVDSTETVVKGNADLVKVVDTSEIVLKGESAHADVVDTTVVFEDGKGKSISKISNAVVEVEKDEDGYEDFTIQTEAKVNHDHETLQSFVSASESTASNSSEDVRQLEAINQNETNIEKLQENFSRLVRVLEAERAKTKSLNERVILAEREVQVAKPKAKELESKLERAVVQISQRKKDVEQVKVKLKQAEQEKIKVENELRNAKAQIATLSKRLAG